MKDTHQSPCQAIMSNSSEAMEACVSPTSTPAESPWAKRPGIHSFQGSSLPENPTQSDWDHPAKDQAVPRIGDAPCDTQGATEPEGVATPCVSTSENESDLIEEKPICGLKPTRGLVDAKISVRSNISREGSGSEIPQVSAKHMPRKLWMPETCRLGAEEELSGGKAILCHPLHTPSNDKCNLAQPSVKGGIHLSQNSLPAYQTPPLPSPTLGGGTGPWKAEGGVAGAVQNQRRLSNLSEIERQRGPIKKRHIHYPPEILDLSTKKAKGQTESKQGLANFLNEGFGSSGRIRPLQNETVISNRAVKQEPCQSPIKEDNKEKFPLPQMCPSTVPTDRERAHGMAGVTNLDLKHGLTEPSASFTHSQLANQMLGAATLSFQTRHHLVPVLTSRELERQWMLHVTQSNEMYPMQHLQAKLAPDLHQNNPPSSEFGHQSSMSTSPTLKNPGRSSQPGSATSTMEKPYACEHCSSKFKHRHHVIRHMRAHNGERPFHCEHCGATFARKCVLTNHRRTHTGEKPYICTECGDTFSRKHHLVIHQRTHSGEKPYRCLECGAAFARSHHVNRHRRTHEKEQETAGSSIHSLKSTESGKKDGKLPTMVPLGRPSTIVAPETESAPSPESVVPRQTGELITNSTAETTKTTQDSTDKQTGENNMNNTTKHQ